MYRIVSVTPHPDLSLRLTFADGHVKRVNIRPFIKGALSQPLAAWDFFQQVTIDSAGGLAWPNGYDICPNFLRDDVEDMDVAAQPTPLQTA